MYLWTRHGVDAGPRSRAMIATELITLCLKAECITCGEDTPVTVLRSDPEAYTNVFGDFEARCASCRQCPECDEPQERCDCTMCERCQERTSDSVTVEVSYRLSEEWCPGCARNNALRCEHCRDRVWVSEDNEDRGWCASCSGTVCHSCSEDLNYCAECEESSCRDQCCDTGRGGLFPYSYTPYPLVFHALEEEDGPTGLSVATLFLGLELEVDLPRSFAEEIHADHGSLLYCKEDSSVNGFEMVSHPMTYAYAMEKFPWELLDRMAQEGVAGPNGLHVHVSRAAFDSVEQQAQWLHFVYVNHAQMTKLARRDPSQWGSFGTQYGVAQVWEDNAKRVARAGSYGLCGRYAAVNTMNIATLEMRIFASTLDAQSVQAALGFVAASVEYVRQHDGDLSSLDWGNFCAWVFAQEERFMALTLEILRVEAYALDYRELVPAQERTARNATRLEDFDYAD